MQLISGPHTYHRARCPHHIIADSNEGQEKEAECNRVASSDVPTYGNIRQVFVCERVSYILLKSIPNNAEGDVMGTDSKIPPNHH